MINKKNMVDTLKNTLFDMMYGMPRDTFISFVLSYMDKNIPCSEIESFTDSFVTEILNYRNSKMGEQDVVSD